MESEPETEPKIATKEERLMAARAELAEADRAWDEAHRSYDEAFRKVRSIEEEP